MFLSLLKIRALGGFFFVFFVSDFSTSLLTSFVIESPRPRGILGKQSLLKKGRGLVESFHIGKERNDLGLILLSLDTTYVWRLHDHA